MSLSAALIGLALLAVNGFFVAAEFALLAARRSRIEQLAAEGDRRARHALAGLRELSLMLAGAQLGITMASLALGAIAEPALHHGFERLLGGLPVPAAVSGSLSLVLSLAIVVFLHMVVGEMAPKSWAIAAPERSVLLLAGPFRLFARVVRPFIQVLNWLSNTVVRALGVTPQDELAMVHSPSDLALLLEESAAHGLLPPEQQRLLSRAIDLSGLDAEAAMIPRSEMVAIPATATIDEIERVASSSGRSRLPVYDDDLDRIRGILHIKDLLAVEDRRGVRAGALARPAMLTPETRPVEDLMLDMRQRRQHLAVVVDEFGTVTGVVALEDLLEELIGDFEDESDRRSRSVRRRPDGAVVVPGAMRPDQLEAAVGHRLPEGEWETLAGFILASLGRLPVVGDRVETDEIRIEVARMDHHRIVEVAILP